MGNGRTEGTWASLPQLLLWMIKDKLDIFDNWRFGAVCRNWQSASECYPKVLQRVGDGLPWIWQLNSDPDKTSKLPELVSVRRGESKLFQLDMPEFALAKVLFSKQGWILLIRRWYDDEATMIHRLVLLNPFTKVKIELPDLDSPLGFGYFTTQEDGYPHRVFLYPWEGRTDQVIIKTACPSDQVWTDHVFSGMDLSSSGGYHGFIAIGDNVYCQHEGSQMIVCNLVNKSWKYLPKTTAQRGSIMDYSGELVFIERSGDNLDSFAMYKHNDGNSSWEVLNNNNNNNNVVMDTSWFLSGNRCCIAAKGGDKAKVYDLRDEVEAHENCTEGRAVRRATRRAHENCEAKRRATNTVTRVNVCDLVTGSSETLRLPFELHRGSCWVDIG